MQVGLYRLQIEAYLADFGLHFIFCGHISITHRVVYLLVDAVLEVIVIVLLELGAYVSLYVAE